jgi:hypothetical protein
MMAGRPQKPWYQLQDQRPSRLRGRVPYIPPPPTAEQQAAGNAALNVAAAQIERQFGQGAGAASPKKSERAKAKQRDERGRFVPDPNSRRARIRASRGALAELIGDEDALIAEASGRGTSAIERSFGRGSLLGKPERPRRPNLLEIVAEVGDDELDAVIAALVKERERRKAEGDEEE